MKQITFLVFCVVTLALLSCKTSKTQKDVSVATLTNTYWKLQRVNERVVVTPDNSREVHIRLANTDNRLQGFAGCNGLGGSYTLSGNNGIKMTVITTKMYCDRMETENFLTGVLTTADNYRLNGEKLSLYKGKKLLASFESVYL